MKPIHQYYYSFMLTMPLRQSLPANATVDIEVLTMPTPAYIIIETPQEEKRNKFIELLKGEKEQKYLYTFADGWPAVVTLEEITTKEAWHRRRYFNSFSRYQWMIDSIMLYGEIRNIREDITLQTMYYKIKPAIEIS